VDTWPGWDGWTPGGIRIRGPLKNGGCGDFAVAGWTKGSLGIDLRPRISYWGEPLPDSVCGFAWVVTHLPTGWAMCGIDAPTSMAQMLVDGLAKLTDWSVITVESAAFMDARIRSYFSAHPGVFFDPSDTVGPWGCDL